MVTGGRLDIAGLTFAYRDAPVLSALDLSVAPGEMVALLGPNGSGKSTLLSLLAGVLTGAHGRLSGVIRFNGQELSRIPARERARQVALVPQTVPIPFAFTVREWVSLGRTPSLSAYRGEKESDQLTVERAIRSTQIEHLAERLVGEISGGERQRATLAMALAQEPTLLLLDEATAHLDLHHHVTLLEMVRRLNREQGLTVIAAVHDVNLAALWFDRLLMLHHSTLVADGTPHEVLTATQIQHVFGTSVQVLRHPTADAPLVALETPHPADVD
ncbi:MAG: ABC transporter ATP-binding protein [Actinomycetota bacterium]